MRAKIINMRKEISIALLIIFTVLLRVQSANPPGDELMREFRAVWLTSVWNIDWPHSTNVSAQAQKNRLITMLNTLQETNINAVLFQVRPNADALYQSAYEPWSQWITGTRGQDPGYDPLSFLISEANKRGIEVHAWLNPYRFENTAGQYSGMPGDYSQSHPELIFTHNNKTYFDPGRPGTTQLIKNIVADLIHNYAIDGVVFDDYFYPSGIPLSADQETFDSFTAGELEDLILPYYPTITRGNFRRASVNNMIKEVNDTVKSIDPHMLFGVSPAGIYSTSPAAAANWGTTLPPGITGADNFNTIFCDPLAWLHDESVDYLSPQLYWPIGGNQDYLTLVEWWGQECEDKGRHAFPSIASYRLPSGLKDGVPEFIEGDVHLQNKLKHKLGSFRLEKIEYTLEEIENQILANRDNMDNNVFGVVFYSTRDITNRVPSLAPFLAEGVFSEKAVPRHMNWLPGINPGSPSILEIASMANDPELAAISIQYSAAKKFLLYAWDEMPKATNSNPEFMQLLFGQHLTLFYPEDKNYFAVMELLPGNELGNTSEPTAWEFLEAASIISPDNEIICNTAFFYWTEVPGSEAYQVVISRQTQPEIIEYTSPMLYENFFELESGQISGQENYVFHVKAFDAELVSYSLPGYFSTAYPLSSGITSPADGDEGVGPDVVFEWHAVNDALHYHLQVATDISFDEDYLLVDQEEIAETSFNADLQIQTEAIIARVRAGNECGYSTWSETITFFMYVDSLLPGDANCDGVVNVLDILTIQNHYSDYNPEPFCFDNADVNNDGIINVLDIIGVAEIFSGID